MQVVRVRFRERPGLRLTVQVPGPKSQIDQQIQVPQSPYRVARSAAHTHVADRSCCTSSTRCTSPCCWMTAPIANSISRNPDNQANKDRPDNLKVVTPIMPANSKRVWNCRAWARPKKSGRSDGIRRLGKSQILVAPQRLTSRRGHPSRSLDELERWMTRHGPRDDDGRHRGHVEVPTDKSG